MRLLIGNLLGISLGSLIFLIPFRDPVDSEEATSYILLSIAALTVSLCFQYLAVSAQKEGRFQWRGSTFDRIRDPKSYTFALLITSWGSSLLFTITAYILYHNLN